MAADLVTVDPALIKAIAHPLRHRILLTLAEQVSSPKRLAAELDEPLGRVSHHVRVLSRLGAIELVDTAQRRGAVEHFYRAVVRSIFSDEDWAALSLGMRRAIFGEYLGRILRDMRSATESAGFEHRWVPINSYRFRLDDEGFDAVADVLVETVRRLLGVRAATAERMARKAIKPIRTEVAMLHFERD